MFEISTSVTYASPLTLSTLAKVQDRTKGFKRDGERILSRVTLKPMLGAVENVKE